MNIAVIMTKKSVLNASA